MHACVLVLREACFRVARLGLPLQVLAFLLISTRCVDVLNVLQARAVPWLCLPVSVWGLIHCRGSGLRDRICYSSVERFCFSFSHIDNEIVLRILRVWLGHMRASSTRSLRTRDLFLEAVPIVSRRAWSCYLFRRIFVACS